MVLGFNYCGLSSHHTYSCLFFTIIIDIDNRGRFKSSDFFALRLFDISRFLR